LYGTIKNTVMEKDEFTQILEARKGKTIYFKIGKVKSEIGQLRKNSANPFFKSKYLDLSDLLTSVEPLLEKYGLLLMQPIIYGKVRTEIVDIDSDEIVRSEIELPHISDPQKIGSAITYFRRYTLQSILSLQAIDDDGNTTMGNKPKLSDALFQKALVKIKAGKGSKEELEKAFTLSKEQIEQL